MGIRVEPNRDGLCDHCGKCWAAGSDRVEVRMDDLGHEVWNVLCDGCLVSWEKLLNAQASKRRQFLKRRGEDG